MKEILELCMKSLECSHPSFMDNKCSWTFDCGDPIKLPFRFIHPNLTLNLDEVTHIQYDYTQVLFNRKKLHLVLDLDHTLIHARKIKKFKSKHRRQNIRAMMSYDDISEFKLSSGEEFVVKLRPGVHEFLEKVSTMFDLSICTMGTREYAHKVVEKLGGLDKFLWVIAREDCVKANQKALDVVLSCREATLIVDDTESVWEESCKANLIKINPYDYDFVPLEKEKKVLLDRELARVLDILRGVYNGFYDGGNEKDESAKDARKELEKVMISRPELGCSNQEQHDKDEKLGVDEVVATSKPKRLRIRLN
ncbi:RNA polymerase II C-terminal domain phosphatase-like 4 [Chenopodium quinoa]|uniref:protein-serine/threonine phosphatase n=1 Tax=Chenopodium quinoa TaxID=63459 RepID=A0A803LN71_CHEQI|nr:RNA polymerase II C-terminal domain phosphatase-like 4 [Chenopodium quinoa]